MVLIINLERTSLVIHALCECDCLRVSKLSSVLFLDSRWRVIELSVSSIRVASMQVASECDATLELYHSSSNYERVNTYNYIDLHLRHHHYCTSSST